MKFSMYFSPASSYFLLLGCKYSYLHRVLSHPNSCCSGNVGDKVPNSRNQVFPCIYGAQRFVTAFTAAH
jgi:hypothetical protein